MLNTIRVQIADDHDVVVQGLQSILKGEPDIEIVFRPARSMEALLDAIRELQPHVLLLDAKMPNFDMLSVLGQSAILFPRLRVIVVTAQQDPQLVKAAARKGAAGYILKEEALSRLLPMAIREVAGGQTWFSPKASQHLIQEPTATVGLSDYQWNVLRLMAQGKTPDDIAVTLQRSVSAIYSVQTQIREKLSADTNQQAVVIAIRKRLVPLSQD
jgi:two-component system response regulator DevR